jgi:hypothetical protein
MLPLLPFVKVVSSGASQPLVVERRIGIQSQSQTNTSNERRRTNLDGETTIPPRGRPKTNCTHPRITWGTHPRIMHILVKRMKHGILIHIEYITHTNHMDIMSLHIMCLVLCESAHISCLVVFRLIGTPTMLPAHHTPSESTSPRSTSSLPYKPSDPPWSLL